MRLTKETLKELISRANEAIANKEPKEAIIELLSQVDEAIEQLSALREEILSKTGAETSTK